MIDQSVAHKSTVFYVKPFLDVFESALSHNSRLTQRLGFTLFHLFILFIYFINIQLSKYNEKTQRILSESTLNVIYTAKLSYRNEMAGNERSLYPPSVSGVTIKQLRCKSKSNLKTHNFSTHFSLSTSLLYRTISFLPLYSKFTYARDWANNPGSRLAAS